MKIKNVLIILAVVFLIVVLIAFAVLGYLGFVPGLSNLFGSNQPRDLGVRFTEQNYNDGITKLGIQIENLSFPNSISETISYIGEHIVKNTLSEEEVTALTNNRTWGSFPIREPQIRINKDNTFEVSGILKIDLAIQYLKKLGVSEEDIKKAMSFIKLPMQDLPFYLKASGSVINNQVDVSFQTFEVGRFPIPINIINQYITEINSLLSKSLVNDFHVKINSLIIKDAMAYLDGISPNIERIESR